MKILLKTSIALGVFFTLTQSLSAKDTVCYKKSWETPSKIEKAKLDGGVCNSEFSFTQMKQKGWKLRDLKIEKAKVGFNYIYTFTDENLISVDNSKFMENRYSKLDYNPVFTKLNKIKDNVSTINIPNLRIGQSGIVRHKYENGKSLIVANALVTSSNSEFSTVKLVPFLDIKQNAIPTSNRKAQNKDEVIINYLYDASLIIAPSQDAFLATREKFTDNNFIHSDLFASELKTESIPLPSKENIQDFAIEQNIGTIFFIIKNNVYIVDSKTFAVLQKDTISYNFIQDEKMPFYTRVENIEENTFKSFLDYKRWFGFLTSFLGDDERSEEEIILEKDIKSGKIAVNGKLYNSYYEKLLGIKK